MVNKRLRRVKQRAVKSWRLLPAKAFASGRLADACAASEMEIRFKVDVSCKSR
jgi:hypothetical protein